MANNYATARGNYFAAKDETTFREWEAQTGLHILEPTHRDKVADGNMPHSHWLSRLLWLVDGDAGPEPGKPVEDKALIPLDRLAARYKAAMTSAWGKRLNCLTTAPETVKYEFTESQARWMSFLKSLEPDCPGISGAARNL